MRIRKGFLPSRSHCFMGFLTPDASHTTDVSIGETRTHTHPPTLLYALVTIYKPENPTSIQTL